MKLFLKRTAAGVLAAVIFLFVSAFCSFAVTVDGRSTLDEWADSQLYNLTKQKSFNNDVKDSFARAVYDTHGNCLYLCVTTEYKNSGETANAGVRLRINSGEPAFIGLDGTVSGDCGYDVETASEFDGNVNTSVTEIAVYFTDEITADDVIMLNIADLGGKESPTCIIEAADGLISTSDGEEPEKTTENKTSAEKTAKAKTSAKSSKKKTERNLSAYKKVTKAKAEYSKKQNAEKTGSKKADKADGKAVSPDELKSLGSVESDGLNREYIIVAAGAVCAAAVSVAAVCAAVRSKKTKD